MKRILNISLILLLFTTYSKASTPPFYINALTASYISDAVYIPKYDHVFFFGNSSMMPYDMKTTATEQPAWFSLGEFGSIDASVLWDDDHLLLFVDSQYVIYEIDSARIISDWVTWPSLPVEWNGEIDACVRWGDDEIMFFSGNEYLLYSISKNLYQERNFFTAWEGWPAKWEANLQAVLKINDAIYFMKDGEYIVLDPGRFQLSAPVSLWKGE